MIATSGFLVIECTKFIFGRGSAPDPAGWDHNVSSDPLVVFYAFMLYFAVTMKCCDPHWKSQVIGLESGHHVNTPCAEPRWNFPLVFGTVKLEWWGYQSVEKIYNRFSRFDTVPETVTDRHTYIHLMTAQTALCMRREGNKNLCGRDGRIHDMRPSVRAEKHIRDASGCRNVRCRWQR